MEPIGDYMINPLGVLNVFKGATGLVKTVVGSRQERDQHAHDQSMGVQNTYAAEFNHRGNRTKWDSFIDGVNRIPRPMFVGFIVYYFVLAVKHPDKFDAVNQSLAKVPEPMWIILGGILGFYFGSRHFQRMGEVKGGFQTAIARVKHAPQLTPPPPKEMLPKWYKIAQAELRSGVREIGGSKDNPRILEYHKATSLKATNDETAWCSAFINWCMMLAGETRTNKANARSWLDWGITLDQPREGCVVVFERGNQKWMGHVGLYAGEEDGQILCLGGNQNNEISIKGYAKSRVLGYRWPL